MRLYVTRCLQSELFKKNQAYVRELPSKLQFPLQYSYKLEFEVNSYDPKMTGNRICKEDIMVFFLNLYKYTDKLMLLWLTFCGAFFPFLALVKVIVVMFQKYGFFIGIISAPILYILTDMLASYIIVWGMRLLKKNITAYIHHRQAGFQELGVRWKVGEDEWLTLELVLDYKHTMETKRDQQQESGQLLSRPNLLEKEVAADLEGPTNSF